MKQLKKKKLQQLDSIKKSKKMRPKKGDPMRYAPVHFRIDCQCPPLPTVKPAITSMQRTIDK
jgi:hypothetical protein